MNGCDPGSYPVVVHWDENELELKLVVTDGVENRDEPEPEPDGGES